MIIGGPKEDSNIEKTLLAYEIVFKKPLDGRRISKSPQSLLGSWGKQNLPLESKNEMSLLVSRLLNRKSSKAN